MFKIRSGDSIIIKYSDNESEAVHIAVSSLIKDLSKVLGCNIQGEDGCYPTIVIGTAAHGHIVDSLIDASLLKDDQGEWRKEAYAICVHDDCLVIAGSDRRGTIYGIYRVSEMLGVSPWYFWADVPIHTKDEFEISEDFCETDYPSVEYRGIFINDEEELEKWAKLHMDEDTIGVHTYEKIFELLLRLRGNYIWPAMHVNSFNIKVENGALAERMGIVVGTSHCDMLMRSNYREWEPWKHKKGYTDAEYDYSAEGTNREILKEYWKESVCQNSSFEVTYTLGMRGIHDSGFETKHLKANTLEEMQEKKVNLLGKVIKDQEEILNSTLTKEPVKLFVPYKEVLSLYDNGLCVPPDVTLIWSNDNYGYIRRYPSPEEQKRPGGNGVYYHNSYWASPGRSYLFICSIPLEQTKYELEKAYENGIRKLWVMNVGALKPLEQQVEFYLRLAWDVGKEDSKRRTFDTVVYLENWINRNFTGDIGKRVAALLDEFDQITNLRKIENLEEDVFSQTSYGDEGAWRLNKLRTIYLEANSIYSELLESEKPSFFEMFIMKIHASYYTNAMFYFADRSNLCLDQGKDRATAEYATLSREFDDLRRKMLLYYNEVMLDGKWEGIVTPEDFPPPRTAMYPAAATPMEISGQGMCVNCINMKKEMEFTDCSEQWIEIGAGGLDEVEYEITIPEFMKASSLHGKVSTEERIFVAPVDCNESYRGKILVKDLVSGEKEKIFVHVNPSKNSRYTVLDGMITIPCDSVTAKGWRVIKGLGRAKGNLLGADVEGAVISYPFYMEEDSEPIVEIHRYPSLNSTGDISVGVSVDDEEFVTVTSDANDEWRGKWTENTFSHVDKLYLELPLLDEGEHQITLKAKDRYFAFSRIVIYTRQRQENNLGIASGEQRLPGREYLSEAAKADYAQLSLLPRKTLFAIKNPNSNSVPFTDLAKQDEKYADTIDVSQLLHMGKSPYKEYNGAIKIDAIAAANQTENAYTDGYEWQTCCGETYGRSNMAMYIRTEGLKWDKNNAPGLHYRADFTGGDYTIWALVKFNNAQSAHFELAIDRQAVPLESLYNKGSMWRYEAEQAWRWIPLSTYPITNGIHTIDIAVLASRIRIERLFVTKGDELPPTDMEWT